MYNTANKEGKERGKKAIRSVGIYLSVLRHHEREGGGGEKRQRERAI